METSAKEAPTTIRAEGTFEVNITPQIADGSVQDATIGRMLLDKVFHGDLEGTSKGQMLTAGTSVPGSAGYVAMEKVDGSLHGRSGSFILQHNGVMTCGVPQLSVTVVPDSGTGELVGLAGKLMIKIEEGRHFYEFDYSLALGKE